MQLGPYTVLEEIARGGNGAVYRAADPQGRLVALKLLLASESEVARQRFQAEVRALTRLKHPYVVPILEAGEYQRRPWLALEFVDGESLEARLQRGGPLSVGAAVRYVQQLAQALSYVHACGVLHRDLKPDNVLLRGDEALLTDFGLVLDRESEGSRLTATGALQGTPGYWAPEQVQGAIHTHGPPTDVYGLGGVLYACLTGRPPAEGRSVVELVLKVRDDPAPPRELRPEVPGWLNDLCVRCLARDPAHRPQSADAVAHELLRGATAPAARFRGRAWIAGGVLLALVAGLGWGWSAWRSADRPLPPELVADPAPPEPPPPEPEAKPDPPPPESDSPPPEPEADPRPPEPEANPSPPEPDPQVKAREANRLRNQGFELFNQGRFDAALVPLLRSVELEPDHAQTVGLYGLALDRLDRDQEAIEAYTRAIQIDPDEAPYWHNRAVSLTKLGRHEEALEGYAHALELDPQLAASHRKRAQSLMALGRLDAALADARRAAELVPEHPVAYALEGLILNQRGESRAAVAAFDRALALGVEAPEITWVRRLRAENLAKLDAAPR